MNFPMQYNLPFFTWQWEYRKRWLDFSYKDLELINKAVANSQKSVTLPSTNPEKKLVINFEKMCQKNMVSGFEQSIRCLIYNHDTFSYWAWKDDFENFISYTPRIVFYLELVFEKKLEKVDILIKDEYEINLKEMSQMNKETKYIRSICREMVDLPIGHRSPSDLSLARNYLATQKLIDEFAQESEDGLKNILFGLPTPQQSKSTSKFIELPSSHQEIITALNAEVQASASTNGASVHVDSDCPIADKCHVYSENSDVYNATLNLTNLQDNNNKFFIIQLLKYHNKKKYAVWFHWGRVGYKGQNNLIECGSNLSEAKSSFEKKFYDKTRNDWEDRHNFKRFPGKYDLLHMDFSTESSAALVTPESKLDEKVQALLKIICSKEILEDSAREMSYDSGATPLGNITAKQILEGYEALNNITNVLREKGICKELVDACSEFYTKIPHHFGRKTPPVIGSIEAINEKMRMLEDLSNICLAMDILSSPVDGRMHPLDKYYRNLECNLIPIDYASEEFRDLRRSLITTHGHTHSAFKTCLVEAFKCVKESEELHFKDYGNKKLLWHGSRISNWVGILKRGLQIAPKEAPSTGYMFGKGIYFADVSSKSANYCCATKKQNEGLLILCEVSLGTVIDAQHATDFSKLPSGFHSVFGIGKLQPKYFEKSILSNEAPLPIGPLEVNKTEDLSLNYNEYIVYNIHQVKMKYLCKVRFDFK